MLLVGERDDSRTATNVSVEVESARRAFARLASAATDEAIDQAVMCKHEGVVRLTNLAASYFSAGGRDDALFDVNSIVDRCLDLIGVQVDAAAEQVRDWRSLSIEQIRALRNAKNLVAPCALIADRVTDRQLSDRLSSWLHLKDDLP